jgi:hypothetical protein
LAAGDFDTVNFHNGNMAISIAAILTAEISIAQFCLRELFPFALPYPQSNLWLSGSRHPPKDAAGFSGLDYFRMAALGLYVGSSPDWDRFF